MTTYKLCLALLKRNKLTEDMLDIYYIAGKITTQQYTELMEKLSA